MDKPDVRRHTASLMRTLRYAALAATLVTAGLLAFPSTASARPCAGDICVPPDRPPVLDQFCAIADGPIVEIICSVS